MSESNGNGGRHAPAVEAVEAAQPELTLTRSEEPASLEVVQALCTTAIVKIEVLSARSEKIDDLVIGYGKLHASLAAMASTTASIDNAVRTISAHVIVLNQRLTPIGRLTFAAFVLLGAALGGGVAVILYLALRKLMMR